MTAYELIERIDRLIPSLDEGGPLLTNLIAISNLEDDILVAICKFFADQSQPSQHAANLLIDKAIASVLKLRHSVINDGIAEVRRLFLEFHRGANPPSDEIYKIYDTRLDRFRKAYDDFLNTHQKGELLQLTTVAHQLVTSIRTDRETLRLVRNDLTDSSSFQQLEPISIYFSDPLRVADIAAKLHHLVTLYAECCEMLGVSAETEPLQPIKIETGSLWLKVAGNLLAIRLLADAMKFVLEFTYRNYTNEGKRRTSNAERLEAVQLIGALAAGLKERGQDDAPTLERMKNASERFAADLEKFVGADDFKVSGISPNHILELPQQSQKLLP